MPGPCHPTHYMMRFERPGMCDSSPRPAALPWDDHRAHNLSGSPQETFGRSLAFAVSGREEGDELRAEQVSGQSLESCSSFRLSVSVWAAGSPRPLSLWLWESEQVLAALGARCSLLGGFLLCGAPQQAKGQPQ